MSKRPIFNYAFNPGAGTLDLSSIPGFDVRNLFAVIHLPSGALIYAPKPGLGYKSVLNGVLRLQAVVGTMSAADPLLVLYEDGRKPAEDATAQAIVTALGGLLQAGGAVSISNQITGFALDGTDATGVAAPAGAVGVRGWLSGIYTTLKGTLKVDGSAVTQPVSATALPLPSNAAKETGGALATLAANSPALGQATSAASIPVVLSSDGPFTTNFGAKADAAATSDVGSFSLIALTKRSLGYLATLAGTVASGVLQTAIRSNAPRVSNTASLAAQGAVVTLSVDGMATGVAQISGTWAGSISWAGSIDGGTTYFPMSATPFGSGGGASVAFATANGQWEFSAAGLTHVQATMTAFTSGSASVLLAASSGGKIARVKAPASDPLPTLDQNNAPFSAATLLTAGQSAPAGKSVGVNATAGGTVTLTLASGGTLALPVFAGWQTFPFAATAFALSNGATGSVYNLA